MIFAIESMAACLLFTLLVKIATAKKSEALVNDYPPVVTDKLRAMGLIAEKPPIKKKDIIRKLIAIVIYAILFALPLSVPTPPKNQNCKTIWGENENMSPY